MLKPGEKNELQKQAEIVRGNNQ
jgi:DNA replication licensing factor MCM6